MQNLKAQASDCLLMCPNHTAFDRRWGLLGNDFGKRPGPCAQFAPKSRTTCESIDSICRMGVAWFI